MMLHTSWPLSRPPASAEGMLVDSSMPEQEQRQQ